MSSEETSYNYWCSECTCSKQYKGDKRYIIIKTDLTFSEEEQEKRYCPYKLEDTSDNVDGIKPLKLMGVKSNVIGSFSSKNKEEKQQILQKRSREHFNKEILERKVELNRKAKDDFKNL